MSVVRILGNEMRKVLMLRQIEAQKCTLLTSNQHLQTIAQSAQSVLETWCLSCGSSLRGRKDWVRHHFGAVEKVPILISERTQLLYFPLYGKQAKDAVWICANELMEVTASGEGQCTLWFYDGTKADVSCSERIIKKQRHRCREILDFLNDVEDRYSAAGSLLEQIHGGWNCAGCIEEAR